MHQNTLPMEIPKIQKNILGRGCYLSYTPDVIPFSLYPLPLSYPIGPWAPLFSTQAHKSFSMRPCT